MVIHIQLGRSGEAAIADDADAEALSAYNWYRHDNGHGGVYARGYLRGEPKGSRKYVYMHAVVFGARADHVNLDGLDNRRENLRAADRSQQGANQSPRAGTSRFKGIYRSPSAWIAKICVNGAQRHLGSFASEEDAARAYDAAAREAWGTYARTNFPA